MVKENYRNAQSSPAIRRTERRNFVAAFEAGPDR